MTVSDDATRYFGIFGILPVDLPVTLLLFSSFLSAGRLRTRDAHSWGTVDIGRCLVGEPIWSTSRWRVGRLLLR